MKLLSVLTLIFSTVFVWAAEFKVAPDDAIIVIPQNNNAIERFAAQELQYHLQLITGVKIPVKTVSTTQKFPFYIGISAPSDKTKPKIEEGRWVVTPNAAYFWGGDILETGLDNDFGNVINSSEGTLYAVYDYLDKQFGVRYLEPGEDGIVYPKQNPLKLTVGEGDFYPTLKLRRINSGVYERYHTKEQKNVPAAFRLSSQEIAAKEHEVDVWLLRMKMGSRFRYYGGHTRIKWWQYYSKTHPGFFALNKYGKREPEGDPQLIKFCVSNPELQDFIVERYLKYKLPTINAFPNDLAVGYCHCAKCRAWDASQKGEELPDSMTDRYVRFANVLVTKARKHDPNAKVIYGAYSNYFAPPQKVKLNKNSYVFFVPRYSMFDLNELQKFYNGWRNAGAEAFIYRPNHHHCLIAMPLGYEKQFFDIFQLALKNKVIGTSFDCLQNYWSVNGIADYILARAHGDPSKSFSYWEDEYCSGFGNAKDLVKEYFQYYRHNIWEKRLAGKRNVLSRQSLYNYITGETFKESDFDKTDAILQKALKLQLTSIEKERVEKLLLANRHSRLLFHAVKSKGVKKSKAINELMKFRVENKKTLNINWYYLFLVETPFLNATEYDNLKKYKYSSATADKWYFCMDPGDNGSKEKWQKYSYDEIKASWDLISINCPWENLSDWRIPLPLRNRLKKYDGIGWYCTQVQIPRILKGRKIGLYFGAVDESCWVYVNGELAGEHLFVKPNDWKTPFTIDISKQIDFSKEYQKIVVKVEDKKGLGGIWKQVYTVAE